MTKVSILYTILQQTTVVETAMFYNFKDAPFELNIGSGDMDTVHFRQIIESLWLCQTEKESSMSITLM